MPPKRKPVNYISTAVSEPVIPGVETIQVQDMSMSYTPTSTSTPIITKKLLVESLTSKMPPKNNLPTSSSMNDIAKRPVITHYKPKKNVMSTFGMYILLTQRKDG
jgi:hypothetical protein